MDGLYRVPPTVAEPPRDRGIVGDVIGQFADSFAFYRELVQNSIDAGTQQVEVSIDHDPTARVVKVAVRDTGEGMTREIVEDQLLVLFRSTKENDDTKIGKFGIGFASVLAPSPNVVVVHTARDGRRLSLHLQRDLSYELFDAGPATRTGTTVELEIALTTSLEAFATASTTALVRWCRHATVPIHLVVRDAGAAVSEVRIDRPLALDHALIEVRAVSADGHITAVVGLTDDAAPYAGFFDQGLTLFEDLEPLIGRIAFKVQDARLGHTLSRDNVRRDEAFDRAVRFADDVAGNELVVEAAEQVRAAAANGDRARYVALCRAIGLAELPIPRNLWAFPLIETVGTRAAFAHQLGTTPRRATHASPITAMLARAAVPVVDVGPAGELTGELHRRYGEPMVDVHHELTRVAPVAPTDIDRAFLWLTSELIRVAHRKHGGLTLAELDGAFADCIAITGDRADAELVLDDEPDSPWLITRKRAGRKPFGMLSRAPVIISVGHPQVVTARALAETDPVAAASLLARLLLLAAGLLNVERSHALAIATLDALGIAGGKA